MKKISIFISLFVVLILNSCNEKTIEIPPFELPETDKVVLIEELTGVQCTNCPNGAKVIRGIEETYGDNVIAIAIHAGGLSDPLDVSKYDLRSEDGDKLLDIITNSGKPSTAINRVFFDDQDDMAVGSVANWNNYIIKELEKENLLFIDLDIEFDTTTREVEMLLAISPIKDLTYEYKLNIAITESKIIDAQKSGTDTILDYEFNNVLRDMITAFDGESIGSNLKKNTVIKKSFTYQIPDEDNGLWTAENIKIVAFVTGGKDSPNYPVLNATEKHLVE